MSDLIHSFATRPLRLAAATLVLALAGSFALTVQAAPPDHGAGGPGMMMLAPGHIDRMLDLVNASAEQRTQIRAIASAAQADLKGQRESTRSLHEQSMQLFMQPTVDARAAEALRQQMLAQHDAASKRMLQAVLDTSRVLSLEQRQTLGQKMAEMRTRHAERAGSVTK